MGFLSWHYTKGLEYYIKSWLSHFDYINHYFSLPLLLKTLFSPWKRLVDADTTAGFNLQKKFEIFTFNLISRGIGAVVRFMLFWAGIVLIVLTFLGGIVGLLLWTLIPVFSFPVYSKYKRRPENFVSELMYKIKASSKKALPLIFESEAGSFLSSHLGVEASELVENAEAEKLDLSGLSPHSFTDIVSHLIKSKLWPRRFLQKKGLEEDDFINAAQWWDEVRDEATKTGRQEMGRPGIARELLYGYTPNLDQYSTDLSTPRSYSHRLIGRENVVSRIERTLTAGASVFLIGEPGVGKKTIVLEFAHRAATAQLGKKMAYRRVLEFDYNFLLSESIDVNKKKAQLSQILAEAAAAGNIILMIRDIQRLTHSDVEGYDFTDVFENYLEKGSLEIIAVSTPADYERFTAPNMRLRKYFETVEAVPPTEEEALEIIIEAAKRWERKKSITIQMPALRKILVESDRYITETPFPEKALEVLDSVVVYVEKNQKKVITADDVATVLSEKLGISFAKLTGEERKKLGNLEEIIHQRLIDQEAAVSLIAKSLRARTVGAVDDDKPVGTFLFLGPTGVGKTETAKVLAQVYYGSEDKILRFDMAEYAGGGGLERLIGSQEKNTPGRLTTAIKNEPASLLLLDEIEKASAEIYNLFLSLLDEGAMTDAFGKKINGSHLFVIGTSNAGAEYIRSLVSQGVKGEELQRKVVEYVLKEGLFSPEFINRFDGVVVYEPLSEKDLIKIAHLMLEDLGGDLRKKGLTLEFVPETAQKLARDGYDPAFGARPMRRIVDLVLGDLIGKKIINEEVVEGDTIRIIPGKGKEEFFVEKVE